MRGDENVASSPLPEGLRRVVVLLDRWRQRLDAALPKFRRNSGARDGTDQRTMEEDEGVHAVSRH